MNELWEEGIYGQRLTARFEASVPKKLLGGDKIIIQKIIISWGSHKEHKDLKDFKKSAKLFVQSTDLVSEEDMYSMHQKYNCIMMTL